jgi:replicative DNA helicase
MEKVLYNYGAEESVLGSIIIDNDAIFDVSHFLLPDHFHKVTHQWIYKAMLSLAESKTPIDPVTLSEKLRQANQLEDVGDTPGIINLMNTVPTSMSVVHYANIVKDLSTRRRIISAAEQAARLAYDETLTIQDVQSGAERTMFNASTDNRGDEVRHISDVARDHLDHLENIREHGIVTGIPTGLYELDDALNAGGLEPGTFVIVAADTGMGKSSLLLNMISHAAKNGYKGALFTLEMTALQVFQRQVAIETKIPVSRYKRGELSQDEMAMYYAELGKLSELGIYIDQSPFLTPMQLLSKCRRMQMKDGLDLVMVDYLALMQSDQKEANETLRLGSISRALKLIAKDLNVPVVCAAQLTSKSIAQRQDKRPQLADMRFSSDPNNDADVVTFIYRDEYYNPDTSDRPNVAEIIFGKQREGPTPTIDLYWQAHLMSFRNLQRQSVDLNKPIPTMSSVTAGSYENG